MVAYDWFGQFTHHSVQIASWCSATRSFCKTIKGIKLFEKLSRISYHRLFWTSSNRLGPPYIRLFEILFKFTRPGPTVFYLPSSKAETTPITNEKKNLSILRHMMQLKPDQLRRLTKKTSNCEIITLICEWLLNVVNGNVPVKIANIERFETAHK